MKIELELTAQQIADLMTTAIESGDPVTTASRGGWCNGLYHQNRDAEPPAGLWYAKAAYWEGDFSIQVMEYDEDTDQETAHQITKADIAAGVAVIAAKFPHHLEAIFGDHDALSADVFLQCVTLKDIVYG